MKDGDEDDNTWCFKDGPYVPQYVCSSSSTNLPATTMVNIVFFIFISSFFLQAESPPPSLTVRVGYVEDGEVFEQEDTFNNVTGEATINVPAHGNLTEINIVMQESTVGVRI